MKLNADLDEFCCTGKKSLTIAKTSTKLKAKLYKNDADLTAKLASFREEIDELQQKLYAQNRQGILFVFQAMDAAGKDGTIRHVLSGVNPAGVEVREFKRPSEEELDHDYLWRCQKAMVQRGRIGIFNRSYYEEVLVCRVHPDIVKDYQRLPAAATKDMKGFYKARIAAIASYEDYLADNGIKVVKFFLNVSKKEQKQRFLERIQTPEKNWKFNLGDVKERQHWDAYMDAYEKAINGTATKKSPWYVIPADDKGTMRLLVSAAILREMSQLDLKWPTLPAEQKAELAEAEKLLLAET
jgi:PPK2 family polyphosphate:nucleotide phosphotransferase